jgi:hypothetical protein
MSKKPVNLVLRARTKEAIRVGSPLPSLVLPSKSIWHQANSKSAFVKKTIQRPVHNKRITKKEKKPKTPGTPWSKCKRVYQSPAVFCGHLLVVSRDGKIMASCAR